MKLDVAILRGVGRQSTTTNDGLVIKTEADYATALVKLLRWKDEVRGEPRPGYTYRSVEDYLLTNGRLWTPKAKPSRVGWGVEQYCYANAYALARKSKGRYRYVEGIAFGDLLDVPHAWCVDKDDNVVDPTWRTLGHAYFGVVYSIEQMRAFRKTTDLCSILNDYKNKYPLLKTPRPVPGT